MPDKAHTHPRKEPEPERRETAAQAEPEPAMAEAPEPAPGAAELEQALAEAEQARDQFLADLQRMAADFDNYRKRVAREQEALVARAHAGLVEAILPVLDDLERALEAAEVHEEARLEDGVRLVHRQLSGVLAGEGLEEIATDIPFDPHVHEALAAIPSSAEEGTILEVVQRGYSLGDRVLRPARVIVAAAPAEED
jgi:molecular chaperone GrpE